MPVNTCKDARTHHDLRTALKEQGRTVNWLVAQLNKETKVSRQYISGLLNGKYPMQEEWERRIEKALGR